MNGLTMKYFVLNPHKRTQYGKASREALLTYAYSIEKENPQLSHDLCKWVSDIHQQMGFGRSEVT